jgi:hypothetical protein
MKNLKSKLLLSLAVSLSVVMLTIGQEKEIELSALKSDRGRQYINQIIKVKGFLVVLPDGTSYLVDDLTRTEINTPMPETSYLVIDSANRTNLAREKYHGAYVSLTGKLVLSKDRVDTDLAKTLGEASLLRLSLAQAPQILRERRSDTEIPRYLPESRSVAPLTQSNSSLGKRSLYVCPRRYAILFSGGYNAANAHPRYWNDIQYLYQVLRTRYGYSDQDIVVIYKDGITPNSSYPVDYPATAAGWTSAVSYLQNRMTTTGRGSLFFFATNHGSGYYDLAKAKTAYGSSGNQGGLVDSNNDEALPPHGSVDPQHLDEVVYFYNQSSNTITDDQLAGWINQIPFKELVAVLEPCFSGGLIWDLRGPNRILMSAANEFEYSWGGAGNDFFAMYFTDALNGKALATGLPVNADTSQDCVVSMKEAFLYAKSMDNYEYLQYEDNGDGISTITPGVGGDGINGDFDLGCGLRCAQQGGFSNPTE